MSERLAVGYLLTCEEAEAPEEKAREVALEQTVELPADCVPAAVLESVVGRVEEITAEGSAWRVRISYPAAVAGHELPQLLNLLFGNISMQRGIRVESVDWPEALLDRLPGPRFGIGGLRRLCDAPESRPLLCVALKPLGLDSAALAERCRLLTLAGVDLIKDDHSLADQSWAPFAERVEACQRAVAAANRESGGSTLYFPNLTGGLAELRRRLDLVRGAGCRGVMVSPLPLGFEAVRSLAEGSGLALLGHPALAGSFFRSEHGIAPQLLLGELFRLIGCDGVIYPNTGGRFSFDERTCLAINDRLRRALGAALPAFPVPGGGIEARRIPEWVERYGADTIFLIGTALYRDPDLRGAAAALARAVGGSASRSGG